MVAISGTEQPATASLVTAVPLRSWNVTPVMPASAQALRHDDRKPSEVHGDPPELVRMMVLRFFASSSATLSGAPTGMTTRVPVFDCRRRMCFASRTSRTGDHRGTSHRLRTVCAVSPRAACRTSPRRAMQVSRHRASVSPWIVKNFTAGECRRGGEAKARRKLCAGCRSDMRQDEGWRRFIQTTVLAGITMISEAHISR